MRTLADLISAELQKAIKARRLSVTAAAKLLNVSRQTMHSYLKGKSLPRREVLERAVREWDLKFQFGEVSLDAFPAHNRKVEAVPKQLDMLQALQGITQKDLKIAVKRVGDSFELEVRIDISAAS